MVIDDATVARSNWHPTSFAHQPRPTDILSRRENNGNHATSTMASTRFGKRAPSPKILLHPDRTWVDDTNPSLGNLGHDALATVTGNKLSSPESPRTLRRAKKRLSLFGVVRPTADSLAPPGLMIPLSPPPASGTNQPDFPNSNFTPPNSPTSRQKPSEVTILPTITYSPPPPSPTCTSPSIQLPSPSAPVLPRIGTHKRPYYSTVRASMNSRPTSDVSSPPISPCSTTFPTTSSAHQFRSSASGRSETSSTMEQPSPKLTCSPSTPFSTDRTQQSPIETVPPLPPLIPLSPTSFSFQTRVRAPSFGGGVLPVLDLTSDDDEDESADHDSQFGMKDRLVKYLGTRSRSSREKVKNPLSLSTSRGRRGRSFGFRSDCGTEVIPPSPTLLTSRSLTGLGLPGQAGSMSGEMELRMTLAERDINSGNQNGNRSGSSFKFRETRDERERDRGRSGAKKLVKTRSSIGLDSNVSPGSLPTSGRSKPRIGFRLRGMMGVSFLGKFQGNDPAHS